MDQQTQPVPQLHDFEPAQESFRQAVLEGLRQTPKRLPCKYLYDDRGSRLFDRICQLPEYYPTRTELSILRQYGGEMARRLGEGCLLIEYGSGSSLKTRMLLDQLRRPAGYVPIDISRSHLMRAARSLTAAYPQVPLFPICADYTAEYRLPAAVEGVRHRVVYFPGSTIGNFDPLEARAFLRRTAQLCGYGGGLLIGVDLKKDPRLLHAAYNDAAGVTALFNLNLLERINRELSGDLVPDRFAHYAIYNAWRGRIEMHLVSLEQQLAHAAGEAFAFRCGESIFTESSYKYTVDDFAQLATRAGYCLRQCWMDEQRLFSVMYLSVERQQMNIEH